ncbi:hypothetical protein HY251_08630, partial [bacterium]|nr:hypothetical protein [bacterium]
MNATVLARGASVAAIVALGFVASSRAEDAPRVEQAPEDPSLAQRRARVEAAEKALVAWAKSETVESPAREEILAKCGNELFCVLRPSSKEEPLGVDDLAREEEQCRQIALLLSQLRRATLGETVETAFFDVSDIVQSFQGRQAPPLGARCAIEEAPVTFADDRRAGAGMGMDAEKLKELVDTRLPRDSDDNAPSEVHDSVLSVRGYPEYLARVRSFLDFVRGTVPGRVGVELRAYRMTRGLYGELARLSDGVALSEEGERLLEKACEDPKVASLVASQSVTACDGVVATAVRLESSSYVAGLEVQPRTGCIVPEIQTVNAGSTTQVRLRLDPGGRSVTVDLSFALAERGSSQREKIQGHDIEMPDLAVFSAGTALSVPLGRAALVGGAFASDAAGDELASVIHLRPSPVRVGGARPSTERAIWFPPTYLPKVPADLPSGRRADVARLTSLLELLDDVQRSRQRYGLAIRNVQDLIGSSSWRRGPDVGVEQPAATGARISSESAEECGPVIDPERFVEYLKVGSGAEECWGDPASGELHKGTVILCQTEKVMARIDALIARAREHGQAMLEVEASTYELDPRLLSELQAIARDEGATGGALTARALARLDEAAARGSGARFVRGGFVKTLSQEGAFFLCGHERVFISQYEGVPGGPGTFPQTSTVRTGTRVVLVPEAGRSGDTGAFVSPSPSFAVRVSTARLTEMGKTTTAGGPVMTPVLERDSTTRHRALDESEGALEVSRPLPSRGAGAVLALVLRRRALSERTSPASPAGPLAAVASSSPASSMLGEPASPRTTTVVLGAIALAFVVATARALFRYARARRRLLGAAVASFVEKRLGAGAPPEGVVVEWSRTARPLLSMPRGLVLIGAAALIATGLERAGALAASDLPISHAPTLLALASMGTYATLCALLLQLGLATRREALAARTEALF